LEEGGGREGRKEVEDKGRKVLVEEGSIGRWKIRV
jgi:hypothetical protein